MFLGALIETSFSLKSRITLTQDEAFLQAHSAFEPERDYKVAQTGLEPTLPSSQMTNLNQLGHCAIDSPYTHVQEEF